MIGTGSNPNVAAAVVIGIEPGWTQRIVDGIAKTGKPVAGFSIEGHGDIATHRAGSRKAKEFVQWATELQRDGVQVQRALYQREMRRERHHHRAGILPHGRQRDRQATAPTGRHWPRFGETSELTGAEHIVSARKAATGRSRDAVHGDVRGLSEDWSIGDKTNDLSESQPTKGNIAGGLTTIEEKALGNSRRSARRPSIVGVLKPAEAPQRARACGSWTRPSAAAEARDAVGGLGRGACTVPDRPGQRHRQSDRAGDQDLRQSARPCSTMAEHIDLDVSGDPAAAR